MVTYSFISCPEDQRVIIMEIKVSAKKVTIPCGAKINIIIVIIEVNR